MNISLILLLDLAASQRIQCSGFGGEQLTGKPPTPENREYAQEKVYAIDFDNRAVKVAKAINLIANDGKSNVYKLNSLDPSSRDDEGRSALRPFLRRFTADPKLDEENQKMIIFSGIMRLKSKTDINMNYLSLVLNSLFTKIQIDKATGGSVIDHWKPSEIKETLIPTSAKDKRDLLGELVKQSYVKRYEMKQLLREAQQMAEERTESLVSYRLQ